MFHTDQNGLNPAWNHRLKYVMAESGMVHHDVPLVIKLYSQRKLGDRYMGEVHRSIRQLFGHANAQGTDGSATLALPITRGSSPIDDAILNISYSFGETIEMEKPAVWKKVLAAGTRFVVRMAVRATIGIDVEVPIYVEDDVVDAE